MEVFSHVIKCNFLEYVVKALHCNIAVKFILNQSGSSVLFKDYFMIFCYANSFKVNMKTHVLVKLSYASFKLFNIMLFRTGGSMILILLILFMNQFPQFVHYFSKVLSYFWITLRKILREVC